VAQALGVPVSSQIVQDIIEALYGTMEYVDIREEFSPSKRKVKPAATTKQLQQTKMSQGGYLDAMLTEDMSADDLMNLLR
jgi:type IV secretory pathway component VirB8